MSLKYRSTVDIPAETARVARAAFPKGNIYMTIRDEIGVIYNDREFASLYQRRGAAGVSPGLLAMVTVMQYAEALSDRGAAEAVRGRIDWKYLLGLELDDPGFDHSVLSEFRGRLLKGEMEAVLLDKLLERLQEKELVKAGGQQRTDSSHVLAAVRQVNRLELVGETMRYALNELATEAPDWLRAQVEAEWFERYGVRMERYRLPKEKSEQELLQKQIGDDGSALLSALYAQDAPQRLRQLPAVKTMREVWKQQYIFEQGTLRWRSKDELPAYSELIQSPYDPEARNRTKRTTNWTGYAVHLTETCDEERPHLITNVETTPATTADVKMTDEIHSALDKKGLLPREHLVDMAYVEAKQLVDSRQQHQVELYGPVHPDTSWQARTEGGFDIRCFGIDWAAQQVTCPAGQVSKRWRVSKDTKKHHKITVEFARDACLICPERERCTKSKTSPRRLQLKARAEFEALQTGRARQRSEAFKQKHKKRAGIEGTISQGVRAFDLRRSRYIGLAKTRLQHIATAVAMNLVRVANWLTGVPRAKTRISRFAALAPT
jgi:transposase